MGQLVLNFRSLAGRFKCDVEIQCLHIYFWAPQQWETTWGAKKFKSPLFLNRTNVSRLPNPKFSHLWQSYLAPTVFNHREFFLPMVLIVAVGDMVHGTSACLCRYTGLLQMRPTVTNTFTDVESILENPWQCQPLLPALLREVEVFCFKPTVLSA